MSPQPPGAIRLFSFWTLDLRDVLQEGSLPVAGPFARCKEASAWLETDTPDLAILDVKLSDGHSGEIAEELGRRGVPFVFYSGHRRNEELVAEFPEAIWTEKPALASAVARVCKQLLSSTGGDAVEEHDELSHAAAVLVKAVA